MMYKKWIRKMIGEYHEGIYTKLELPSKFLDYMDISKVDVFMKDLKDVSLEKFDDFLDWFDKSFPEGRSLNDLINFNNRDDLQETKQKILAIRKWLNER